MYLSSSWRYNVQPKEDETILEDQELVGRDQVSIDEKEVNGASK